MAKKLNPYYLHTDTYENSSRPLYSLTTSMGLRQDQVDPVYITQDGKIIATCAYMDTQWYFAEIGRYLDSK